MPKVVDLQTEDKTLCYGLNNPDASQGVLFQNAKQASPDTSQRCLILGVGGQGCKAVNAIKAAAVARFENFNGYMAFMAVDTDHADLKLKFALDENEKYALPKDGHLNSKYNQREGRSIFTNSWINPLFSADMSMNGANRIRQGVLAKTYAPLMSGSNADSELKDRITANVNRITATLDRATMKLRVHVLMGIGGGTGSGLVNEIAHIVHEALRPDYANCLEVYGYVLLPDITEQYLAPVDRASSYANAYAALKELDYYYSAFQRNSSDWMKMSPDTAEPMEFKGDISNKDLYKMVYLVSGSNGTGVADKNKTAIDTVSESIIYQLCESNDSTGATPPLTTSILSNAEQARLAKLNYNVYQADGREVQGEFGEDCYNYDAIGIATAAIPERSVKTYAISKILRTVSGKVNGFTPSTAFKGFTASSFTEQEAAAHIERLLIVSPQRLEEEIKAKAHSTVTPPTDFTVARNDILNGTAGDLVRNGLSLTNNKAVVIQEISDYLDKAYAAFWTNLKSFLTNYGPKVYVDMWRGLDAVAAHYDKNMGSRWSLFTQANGTALNRIKVREAEDTLRDAEEKIRRPLLGRLDSATATWLGACVGLEQEKAAAEIAESFFRAGGQYHTLYLEKIRNISLMVADFAEVLDTLLMNYESMGTPFDQYTQFVASVEKAEKATNLNIISNESDYNWAKDIVDRRATAIAYQDIKEAIIDSFMKDPEDWINYDPEVPTKSPRRMLDTIVAPYVVFDDELNVVNYIQYALNRGGNANTTLTALVSNLKLKAAPLYKVDPRYAIGVATGSYGYLIVPNDLFLADPTLGAIFQNVCSNLNVSMWTSATAESLVYYTFYSGLPLYALGDLQSWQNHYEKAEQKMLHANESNQGIYNEVTGLPWKDYPALVLKQDPRLPDQYGNISREGEFFRRVLDPLFDKALSLGVIEEVVDAGGRYSYFCYLMDKPGWDYRLSLEDYENAGGLDYTSELYRTGAFFFNYIANKNRHLVSTRPAVDAIREAVALNGQGQFNEPTSDRHRAIDRAKRALRRNVPQFIALKASVAKYEEVTAGIREANRLRIIEMQERERNSLGKLLPYYLCFDILVEGANSKWFMKDYPVSNANVPICNMNRMAMRASNNAFYFAGLTYQVLRKAFVDRMASDTDVKTFYQPYLDDLANHGDDVMIDSCKAKLSPFVEEANKVLRKHDGDSAAVRREARALMAELGIGEEAFKDILAGYKELLNVYSDLG